MSRKSGQDWRNSVIKTSKYKYEVATSFWSFAINVSLPVPLQRKEDVCYYEVISNQQCTYVDLDLKRKNCLKLTPKLESNP